MLLLPVLCCAFQSYSIFCFSNCSLIVGQGATHEAEAEDGTVGIAHEVEVVLTTVTRVIGEFLYSE